MADRKNDAVKPTLPPDDPFVRHPGAGVTALREGIRDAAVMYRHRGVNFAVGTADGQPRHLTPDQMLAALEEQDQRQERSGHATPWAAADE